MYKEETDVVRLAKEIFYESKSSKDFTIRLNALFDLSFEMGGFVTDYIMTNLTKDEMVQDIIVRVWAYNEPCHECGKPGKLYKKMSEDGLFRNCPTCVESGLPPYSGI